MAFPNCFLDCSGYAHFGAQPQSPPVAYGRAEPPPHIRRRSRNVSPILSDLQNPGGRILIATGNRAQVEGGLRAQRNNGYKPLMSQPSEPQKIPARTAFYSALTALARSGINGSVSPFLSMDVSLCIRFSCAAFTNEENSGCAFKGFDLYSG